MHHSLQPRQHPIQPNQLSCFSSCQPNRFSQNVQVQILPGGLLKGNIKRSLVETKSLFLLVTTFRVIIVKKGMFGKPQVCQSEAVIELSSLSVEPFERTSTHLLIRADFGSPAHFPAFFWPVLAAFPLGFPLIFGGLP